MAMRCKWETSKFEQPSWELNEDWCTLNVRFVRGIVITTVVINSACYEAVFFEVWRWSSSSWSSWPWPSQVIITWHGMALHVKKSAMKICWKQQATTTSTCSLCIYIYIIYIIHWFLSKVVQGVHSPAFAAVGSFAAELPRAEEASPKHIKNTTNLKRSNETTGHFEAVI